MDLMLDTAIWRIEIENPEGERIELSQWANFTITENFDQSSATITTSASRPELVRVLDLVSDVVFYRDNLKMFRFRVVDSEDVITEQDHDVTLICVSYEALLKRRILYQDIEWTDDQHDFAWRLIEYTQGHQTLGITRLTGVSGQNRTRTIVKGATIHAAISDVAASDNGFDWWIDEELQLNMQTPRREEATGEEWSIGAGIAKITTQSFADQYDSSVLVTGSQQEVSIPQSGGGFNVYPPPTPVVREIASMPRGRWERAFNYPDILTNASVDERALWHIENSSIFRPSFLIEVSPLSWRPTVRTGSLVDIVVLSPPRQNFKVQIRIEEMQIAVTADGNETVTVSARAETAVTDLSGNVPPINNSTNTPPTGAVITAVTGPTGLSRLGSRVSPVNRFADIVSRLSDRLTRQERTI